MEYTQKPAIKGRVLIHELQAICLLLPGGSQVPVLVRRIRAYLKRPIEGNRVV